MAKKKRKPLLPRVTVLGMNRKELTNFVLAVEKMGLLVDEMRIEVDKLKGRRTVKPTATPVVPLEVTT